MLSAPSGTLTLLRLTSSSAGGSIRDRKFIACEEGDGRYVRAPGPI